MSESTVQAPPELLDIRALAEALGLSQPKTRKLAATAPVAGVSRGQLLYHAEVLDQLRDELARQPPKPAGPELPRLPGSRWRLKHCQRCTKPFDPPGPAARWCPRCRAIVMAEREASNG